MASEYEVECPMPECTEALALEYETGSTLVPEDVDPDGMYFAPADIREAPCQTWKVACMAGHVILVPGQYRCPCGDPDGPDCECNQDAYDWHEEHRTFRPHDRDRLVKVMAQLRSLP